MMFIRPTRLNYITKKKYNQNGLLLNVETSSQELVILSYATVCLYPSMSFNFEVNVLESGIGTSKNISDLRHVQ